ncbi:MAG: ATPase central domain protein [Acidimicrobiaceae bacterium]|nr:ATPase central domain protein [Acidimicrobiaceae bacterium]
MSDWTPPEDPGGPPTQGGPDEGHEPASNGRGGHAPQATSTLELPELDPTTAPSLGEPAVRPRLGTWDRIKILFLLVALWWVLTWGTATNNPIEPFRDVLSHELRSLWWLEALIGFELLRQLHYKTSEHSARWHRLWTRGVFGRLGRLSTRMGDWNRFRMGRALRVLLWLFVLAVILGAVFHTSPAVSLFQVPAALYTALPFAFQLMFGLLFGMIQIIGIFWVMSRGGVDVYYPGDVKTRFNDVWGQDAVLDRVKENIIFLKDPEAIESRGGYVPGGILLWGPPGTGKTLIAEAVAGETQNPFVFVDPGAFINMFMGVGILKVKSLFRKLRRLALRYGGVVVFFDEADSLGNRGALTAGGVFGPKASIAPTFSATFPAESACHGSTYLSPATASHLFAEAANGSSGPEPARGRVSQMMAGAMSGGGGMGTLQSLLSEISGLSKPRGFFNRVVRRLLGMRPKPPPKYRILIIMATNMPDSLDEAMLRPGRIDRIYKVGYPSKAGRIRTYQGYFSKVANDLTADELDRLATMTPYATGASIKDLVNESLINAIRENRDRISWQDVLKAKQLKELGPPEDVEYIERERHAVAIHEACHAVAAARLPKDWAIDVATIEKGGDYLGMVKHVRAEDTFTMWKSDFESDIMVSLASLAGERMFFDGDSASGVSGDLASATRIATFMEGYWGMGQTVASHEVTQQAGVGGGGGTSGRDKGEKDLLNNQSLGGRIEVKLAELLERTERLLTENRTQVLAVAHALEQHKTITGEDVAAIVEGRPGPFVDGRRYHEQTFSEVAEAYHAAVVAAHKARIQLDIPLPQLPSIEEEPALSLPN